MSDWASFPFCSLKPPEDEDWAGVDEAGVTAATAGDGLGPEDAVFDFAGLVDFFGAGAEPALLEPVLTPGSCVRSTSCDPPAIGPLGCALHEPAGLRGVLCPNGIVPAPPTAMPPTNTF